MAKSLVDLNHEYEYNRWVEDNLKASLPKKGSVIKNAIFYIVLSAAVLLAFIYSNGDTPAKKFGPFAYSAVLSGSMESVYPTGSLILSWDVKNCATLKSGLDKGSDIVYVKEGDVVVVHRIIEIFENYEDSGQYAFRTQGVENNAPDDYIVYEAHIIGEVTGHVPYLGAFLGVVADNIVIIIIGVVLIFVILSLLKLIFKKDSKH